MNRITRMVRASQEGSLYLLLVLLPFSIAAVEVLFGVLLLGWLIERARLETRHQTLWVHPEQRRLVWALSGFLGACALSVVVSGHRWLSVNGLINKWLEYLLFLVIVADVASRPRVAERSLTILVASSVLVVVDAVSQELLGRGLLSGHRMQMYGRMIGPYKNPIDLATYLIVISLILLVYVVRWRGLARGVSLGALLALLACLIRTESEGAWIAFGGSLGLLIWCQRSLRRAGLVLAVVLLLGAFGWLHHVGRLHSPFSSAKVGTNDRWMMWQAAIRMIQDRPILGHGVNTFMANYLDYWVGGERQPRYAHNCYLQMAAETGLVGLTTFLWLLGEIFTRLFVGIRKVRSTDGLVLFGLTAGLLAFIVQAGVDTNFYSLRQAALFWTLAGLAVGLSQQRAHVSPTLR